MKKVLLFGASGMLGHKILLKLKDRFALTGTLRKPCEPLSQLLKDTNVALETGIDVFDQAKVRALIERVQPDFVINCIGIVKQLKEAKDPYISISVNALFPHQLERMGQEFGFDLIHFSTDCVFSGTKGPYTEDSQSDVSDLYGQTKYLGEVRSGRSLTIRTSIVGQEIVSPYTGLFEWYLSQPHDSSVKGFTGALYTGLTTNAMADLVGTLMEKGNTLPVHGMYHVSSDFISKFDLLNIVRDERGGATLTPDDVFHCDRRLDSARFRTDAAWVPPSWQEMVRSMFREDDALYASMPAKRRAA